MRSDLDFNLEKKLEELAPSTFKVAVAEILTGFKKSHLEKREVSEVYETKLGFKEWREKDVKKDANKSQFECWNHQE